MPVYAENAEENMTVEEAYMESLPKRLRNRAFQLLAETDNPFGPVRVVGDAYWAGVSFYDLNWIVIEFKTPISLCDRWVYLRDTTLREWAEEIVGVSNR
jgi:hypothetical protein